MIKNQKNNKKFDIFEDIEIRPKKFFSNFHKNYFWIFWYQQALSYKRILDKL